MNCPKCGIKTNLNKCPQCYTNIALYKKIKSQANLLYNKGLSYAVSGDISRAIETLNKACETSKDHMNARNLLGLCYYNVGRVSDALKHWIVSVAMNKTQNPAKAYIDDVQNDSRSLDRLNDAVKMYNQSIVYLRNKSEDMAIIQLKKAAELSPSFVDAHNLLALCYIMANDYDRALSSVEKSLSIDAGNYIASSYFQLLGGKSKIDFKRLKEREPKKEYKSVTPINKNSGMSRSLPIVSILCFIVGAVISLAIVYYLMIPDIISEKDKTVASLNTQIEEIQTKQTTDLAEKDKLVEAEKLKYLDLENKNKELIVQIELQDRISRVHTANSVFAEGRNEEAVLMVRGIDQTDLPIDISAICENILAVSYPPLVLKSYNEGTAFYNQRAYVEAKTAFLKCVDFHYEGCQYTDDALYFLGRIAEIDGDIEGAKIYYNRIINEFSDSNQTYNTNARLNNL